MSVNQLKLDTLDVPFVTRNLFTRHYLLSRLPKHPIWSSSITDAREKRDEILKLFNEKKKTIPKMSEAQLEHEFVRKVLDALGHKDSYTVQVPILLGSGKFKKPDYVFFKDKDTKKRAYEIRTKDSEGFYSMASGIGEAKEWDLDLNKKPSIQIMTYLKFGGPRWGILTNGRKWRIYHKEARVDSYYEVDLIDHLENGNNEKFNYFFLFFRREAFVADGVKDRCFLDEVLDGSLRFAKQLEDDVRENVYKALRLLCKGFLKYPKNNLKPEDLPQIRESCLILLYRLLFVLYAEAKKLLPLEDPIDKNEYGSISLEALRRDVANNRKSRKILPTLDTHWTHLKRLFEFINEGSEKQGVPKEELFITSYNGGLFDPEKPENNFLEEKRIGNQYLDNALDLLSRSKDDEGNPVEVDYDTLSIRHLGSIYEGLLEYKVIPASEDLAEVEGVDTYVPLPKAQQEGRKILGTYEKGEPILQTDKGERKATGSYYTPDYIVKYIVKNTLGPLIEEKRKEWETGDQKEPLWKKYLELKVLDPAMGSGHFLVEAVNFIGEEVLQAWMQQHEEDENPPLNEGTIEWARHEVVRHCVFGVDLNPLAVELAKLSLWLATVQVNRPLSFLDHHLKCGNSLIGARLNELAWFPGKTPKETSIPPAFIETLEVATKKILSSSDETLEGVKEQEIIFRNLRNTEEYNRIKTIADARISLFFGNTINVSHPEQPYNALVDAAFKEHPDSEENLRNWKRKTKQNWIIEATKLAEEKQYFHWELEFPEAFFEGGKPKENPGFDAVVGNPPYVRQELIVPHKKYFDSNYIVYGGRVDIYAYFMERSLQLLRGRGMFSFIVSRKFMNVKYGEKLREIMISKTKIKDIIDFGDLPVFGDVTSYPCIFVIEKEFFQDDSHRFTYCKMKHLDFSTLEQEVISNSTFQLQKALSGEEWTFADAKLNSIKKKMEEQGIPLIDFCGEPLVGIKTGLNEIFVVDDSNLNKIIGSSNKEKQLFLPFVFGKSFNRYTSPALDSYILFPYIRDPKGELIPINLSDFPNVKMYLEKNKDKVSSRAIIREKAPKGEMKWFELQQINKNIRFEKPKIVYRDLSDESSFTIDRTGSLVDMTAFILESSDPYLLSLLNSNLLTWYVGLLCARARGDWYRYKTQYVRRIPIPYISSTTPPERHIALVEEAKNLYQEYLTTGDHNPLLNFVKDRVPKDNKGEFITEKDEADVIRDLLAYLAEQMIEMNKLKQDTLRKFKTDLEGVLGDKVKKISRLYTPLKEPTSSKFKDEAKLQEKMERYEEKKTEAKELLGKELARKKLELEDFPILTEEQQKELLKRKLGKIPNLSQVLMIFQKYRDEIEIESDKIAGRKVTGLKELYARIDSPYPGSTDWLIDQIVYKLYGLTDEEIAIVEKSLGSHQIGEE